MEKSLKNALLQPNIRVVYRHEVPKRAQAPKNLECEGSQNPSLGWALR